MRAPSPSIGSASAPTRNLLSTNEHAMFEFWSLYSCGTHGLRRTTPDYALSLSGLPHPLFNGVFRPRSDAERAPDLVQQICALLRVHKAPAFWWVNTAHETEGLAVALELAGGCAVGECPAMFIAIDQLPATPVQGRWETREVRNLQDLSIWTEIAARGTELPPKMTSDLLSHQARIFHTSPLRHFIGCVDGKPVAVAGAWETRGVVLIVAVAVLPEFRRRGCGAAISAQAARASLQRGITVATLQASESGWPVYRRLGFEAIGNYRLYLATP